MPILANLKRPSSHPHSPADPIHMKYQALDDPEEMIAMCREVRALDRQDGRQAFGNGAHSPAIREAGKILLENLHSGDTSEETKIAIVQYCVPILVGVVSGNFPDVFEPLFAEIVRHRNLDDAALAMEAGRTVVTMQQSGKIDNRKPSLRGLLARRPDLEQLQA